LSVAFGMRSPTLIVMACSSGGWVRSARGDLLPMIMPERELGPPAAAADRLRG